MARRIGKGDRDQRLTQQQYDRALTGGDPYLRVERGTRRRASKGDEGNYTRVVSDTSSFKLDTERAADPRNWEYWYKERHGTRGVSGTAQRTRGKDNSRTISRQTQAIDEAKSLARRQGDEAYEIMQEQAEIARLEAETEELKRVSRESVRWTTSQAQKSIAQQKMMSRRRGGRGPQRQVQRQTVLG